MRERLMVRLLTTGALLLCFGACHGCVPRAWTAARLAVQVLWVLLGAYGLWLGRQATRYLLREPPPRSPILQGPYRSPPLSVQRRSSLRQP